MTFRTETPLICVCGHKGMLRTAENDAPFSTEWFRRTVTGFIDYDEGFSTKDLGCPECGRRGEVKRETA